MERKEVKTLIAQAARAFDAELHTKAYRKTHADFAQLNHLLSFLPEDNSQVFLDLGTGDGYVAMEPAKRYASSIVIGVDIAEKAIRKLPDCLGAVSTRVFLNRRTLNGQCPLVVALSK